MKVVMNKEDLKSFLQNDFPQVANEFAVDEITEEGLVLRRHVDTSHLRPGGTVSGPTMFGLADVAVYLAILSRIGPRALTVTTSCAMDFLRKPAADRDLLAEVRLLKIGKVLAIGDVLIRSEGVSAPVARANMTYSIPPESES